MDCRTLIFFGLLCCLEVFGQGVVFSGGNSCASDEPCTGLYQCPPMVALLRDTRNRAANLKIIRKATCLFDPRNPKVCCPSATPTTSSPKPPKVNNSHLLPESCGTPSLTHKIVGGEDADSGEFPWQALFVDETPGKPNFYGCGGTVINDRYVLTAAHCKDQTWDYVRLGEHDLRTSPDCEVTRFGRSCNDPEQQYGIESFISHPSYDTRGTVSDDIALVRLDRKIQFSDYIQPVCLPKATFDTAAQIREATFAWVTGWGRTDNIRIGANANILQKIKLPHFEKERCSEAYGEILKEQFCLGGLPGKDSCSGDSGGPVTTLVNKILPYYLIGVVSFGPRKCGTINQPGVYTDVAAYKDWIVETIQP